MNSVLYEALARLLDYPDADFAESLGECRALSPDEDLAAFAAAIDGMTETELEEAYIQTFDFNPKCTLDLGWQLFAEDYNRGLFLAKLRAESRRLELPETTELPDHLTHALRLLARMAPDEAAFFAASCCVPAVEKTFEAIDESNPFRPLVGFALSELRELAAAHEFEEEEASLP